MDMGKYIILFFKIDDHAADFVIGQSMEKWGIGETISGTNANSLFPGKFDYAYLSNAQGITSGLTTLSGEPQTAGRLASFFGRLNYNYQENICSLLLYVLMVLLILQEEIDGEYFRLSLLDGL